jgi:dephospho-CoA kinase
MPLIYITGPTGSGKSTICSELKAEGYETYDIDSEGVR